MRGRVTRPFPPAIRQLGFLGERNRCDKLPFLVPQFEHECGAIGGGRQAICCDRPYAGDEMIPRGRIVRKLLSILVIGPVGGTAQVNVVQRHGSVPREIA